MKHSNLLHLTTITACLLWGTVIPIRAQAPKDWKWLQQTFISSKRGNLRQVYKHSVTLDKTNFISRFYRDFGTEGTYSGFVTTKLKDIDIPQMKLSKGKEGYTPDYWYLYVPVRNPKKVAERRLATPQTDRTGFIVKDQVSNFQGRKTEETWLLTRMYLNFNNEAAARQAAIDIIAACQSAE